MNKFKLVKEKDYNQSVPSKIMNSKKKMSLLNQTNLDLLNQIYWGLKHIHHHSPK